MSAKKFHPGDKVAAKDYDASERPANRVGVCEVISVEKARCESGWMVTLKSIRNGAPIALDQNWLEYADRQQELSIG